MTGEATSVENQEAFQQQRDDRVAALQREVQRLRAALEYILDQRLWANFAVLTRYVQRVLRETKQ